MQDKTIHVPVCVFHIMTSSKLINTFQRHQEEWLKY